ncbi:MAG: hypothetical protein J7J82_06165 [Staphylothermus sp.]|nr:hypothetical protein [Staphylothermus sp.]
MNWFNQLKKKRTVALKNFDEETYRLVKTFASLEGRTVSSVFEEAVKEWLIRRRNYEEVLLWNKLEKAYEENMNALIKNKLIKGKEKGYVLVCNGEIIGIYNRYEELIEEAKKKCRAPGLVVRIPYEEESIDLGLPW